MEDQPISPDPVSAGAEPPIEFVRQVRDALAHLYDPAHLVRHPLTERLLYAAEPSSDRGRSLRDFLLDGIEELESPRGGPTAERDQRPHLILVHRYVDGFSTEDILARLHLSPRQFQREHRKALQALASHLWARCSHDSFHTGMGETTLQAEMHTLGVELTETLLSEVLLEAQEPTEALARRLGFTLQVHLPARPLTCLCDRTLSKQALISALSTLAAHSPHSICLHAEASAGWQSIRLLATPILPAAVLPALEHALNACRSLLLAQGGQAKVLRDDQAHCLGVELQYRAAVGSHVLVVDDNPRMLRLYERYLASGQFTATGASSSREAEEALAAGRPDAIVLDVMMRDTDGWDLLQRLRSRAELKHVPIVVCSVLDEPDLAYALGAQAYLKKPVAPEDLLPLLHDLLSGSNRAGQHPGGH